MQTKRLHISGLTPAISEKDLTSRFSVFGNVKAVHGIGELNAVGQPRNFAFVSLEATPERISKCLNVLSGSTWKGTKLKIGDARLDYKEKLLKDSMEPIRPAKRRKLAPGVESKDMSLVTLENVDKHSGWMKTSLSHLVRPLRMRPLHPLPSAITQVSSSCKSKKRKFVSPTRARRRKIDPTLYGSVHMTEAMLQADHVVIPPVVLSTESPAKASPVVKPPAVKPPVAQKKRLVSEEPHDAVDDGLVNPFEAERQKNLSLLALLFDGKEKWEGREEDLDGLEDLIMEERSPNVPKETDTLEGPTSKVTSETLQSSDEDPQSHPTSPSPSPTPPPPPIKLTTLLKDLFASRIIGDKAARSFTRSNILSLESVSILQGLDLDLEDDFAFDEMVNFELPTERQVDSRVPLSLDGSMVQARHKVLEQVQISNTAPYFFPLDLNERSRGTIKDIMSVSAAKGWMQPLLNPMTPDDARKQWETKRVALTRDWKQRHREASKRQRKGTAINDIG